MQSAQGPTSPEFSVVVPIAPGRRPLVLDSLETLVEGTPSYEVLVHRGANPSRSRNLCIQQSRAGIFAFTDDDCVVAPDWLHNASQFFGEHPECHVVGGPQLNLTGESLLGRAIGHALGSAFGTSRMSRRYRPAEPRGRADEQALTSANLFVTRAAMERWGLFDERLWPNEETALIRRIELGGGRIAYDPTIVVSHKRRASLWGLARQCFGYGTGRARQAQIEGLRSLRLEQLIPSLFLVYVGLLPVLGLLWPGSLAPLAAYGIASLGVSFGTALARRDAKTALLLPVVFGVIHAAYPSGLFWEAFRMATGATRLPPTDVERLDAGAPDAAPATKAAAELPT